MANISEVLQTLWPQYNLREIDEKICLVLMELVKQSKHYRV